MNLILLFALHFFNRLPFGVGVGVESSVFLEGTNEAPLKYMNNFRGGGEIHAPEQMQFFVEMFKILIRG